MALYFAGASPKLFTYSGIHKHEYYELILTTEGEGVATIAGKEYPFKAGTIHIVPPNTPHRKQAEKGFRDIYFHADTLSAGPSGRRETEPIVLSDDTEKTFEKLMRMILSRYLQMHKNDVVLQSMYDLALRILEEWQRKDQSDPVVEDVMHTLALSFSDPELTVSQVLIDTGYNLDYIRRRFTEVTKTTPSEYLTSIRISYAKKLLKRQRQMRLSVADVSVTCGYYDVRYFCRIFKKQTGLTPTEYAKEQEKDT